MNDDKIKKSKPRRAKGMGSIYQRPNGKFQGRISIAGYGQFSCTGNTRQEVQKKMDDFRRATLREEVIPQRIFVGKFIEDWLENVKRPTLKASSYDRLEKTYMCHIKDSQVARLQLGNITSMDIQRLINEKSETLSYSSVRKIYELLHACFEYAVVNRFLNFNPMAAVQLPKEENMKVKKKEIKIFTEEELSRIEAVSKITYDTGEPRYRHVYFFILLANTGLRAGEAIALRWQNVDLNNKLIHVKENAATVINRDGDSDHKHKTIVTSVKTKNGNRVIPINEKAMNALLWLKDYQKHHHLKSEFVDCNRYGGMLTESTLPNLLRPILEEAKVPYRGCHAFRHTFGTRLIEAGVDPKVVSQLLGHSSISITYDIYVHPDISDAVKAVSLLDQGNQKK